MLTTPMCQVHVRWMIDRDMPQVIAIEDQSFEYAWDEREFRRLLALRNVIGMVAEVGEVVVGYMVYMLEKRNIELMNLAVHPAWRRLGVGSQMTSKLKSKLSTHRRTQIGLDVRETNVPAQVFFREQRFFAYRTIRNHFSDSREDAYRFMYLLQGGG